MYIAKVEIDKRTFYFAKSYSNFYLSRKKENKHKFLTELEAQETVDTLSLSTRLKSRIKIESST